MKRDQGGFTFVELLFVIAVVAIAAALAVPSVMRARRVSAIESARTEIASALRRTSERAAVTGAVQPFSAYELPLPGDLVLMPGSVGLPDGTAPGASIAFEGGTGYPLLDGARQAVAIVAAEREAETTNAVAIVISRSGIVTEHRRGAGGWERIQ